MGRVRVAGIADVAPGQGRVVEAGGRSLALFNVDGQLYALDNACPHRGGPLGEGLLDGSLVACPWHRWRWNVATGRNADNEALAAASHPVTVEGDGVYVDL